MVLFRHRPSPYDRSSISHLLAKLLDSRWHHARCLQLPWARPVAMSHFLGSAKDVASRSEMFVVKGIWSTVNVVEISLHD